MGEVELPALVEMSVLEDAEEDGGEVPSELLTLYPPPGEQQFRGTSTPERLAARATEWSPKPSMFSIIISVTPTAAVVAFVQAVRSRPPPRRA